MFYVGLAALAAWAFIVVWVIRRNAQISRVIARESFPVELWTPPIRPYEGIPPIRRGEYD